MSSATLLATRAANAIVMAITLGKKEL